MVISVDIRSNISDVVRQLKTNRTDQIPFATAVALTKTAQRVSAGLKERLPQIFDRPTPYTLNAFYVRPATKANLVASIGIKDEAPKGTPADRYLRPQIEGGGRNLKRSERALQAMGYLPPNSFAVPGSGAEIDQYGNMKAGQIVAMLASLKILPGAAYTTDQSFRPRRRRGVRRAQQYFVAVSGSHLRPGVYRRLSAGVVPVLLFVRPPEYHQRFDFDGDIARMAPPIFTEEFTEAWTKALATAR